MANAITNHRGKKIPKKALELLRLSAGSFSRLARRQGVSRSHVSKVLSGERRSERVRRALLREAARLAKLRGLEVALQFEEAARR